jgi:nitroreductase
MARVSSFTQEENTVLDRILESRRSIRAFAPDIPPKEKIVKVIRAGLLAPYPGLRVAGDVYFRRFVVIEKDSPQIATVAEIATRQVKSRAEQLKKELQAHPSLQSQGQEFVKRLERLAKIGVPGIGTAPYYIVVAEQRGFPPVEQESLAHCLQNMWLKATALGLGFHLVSATAQMAQDKEFCSLLGIPYGEFGMNGCALGYPKGALPPASHPTVDEVTKWIE